MTNTGARLFPATCAAATLAITLTACGGAKPAEPPKPEASKPQYGSFGIDLTARNTAVKPGDDFFALRQRHLVRHLHDPGGQERRTAWPNKLDDEARANVRTIIEDARPRKPAAGIGGAEDRRLLRVVHGHGQASRPRASPRSRPISIASPR